MAIPLRSVDTRRSTARSTGSKPPPPRLQVVPKRRRWPAVFVTIALLVVGTGMLGAAVFHTQLAQRQLEIDRLETAVDDARERFDELRRDRAVLRSPRRIADEAERLGMVRGETSAFAEIDPTDLARQIAAGGAVDAGSEIILDDADPLDQFRDVKSVSSGQP